MTLSDKLAQVEACTCDAQFSGRDEAEYRARGCPSCTCTGPIFQAIAIELAKLIEPFGGRDGYEKVNQVLTKCTEMLEEK